MKKEGKEEDIRGKCLKSVIEGVREGKAGKEKPRCADGKLTKEKRKRQTKPQEERRKSEEEYDRNARKCITGKKNKTAIHKEAET